MTTKANNETQGRPASASVGARSNGATAGRVRTDSISVDDDVELAVPEHKIRMDGSPDIGKKKVNPVRMQLKAKVPEATDREAFTYNTIEALDANDPNYDPTEHVDDESLELEVIETGHLPLELRKALEQPMIEFFEEGEAEDFIENMLEIDTSELMRISAVVIAVEKALERNDDCRELVSRLLVDMVSAHTVSSNQIVKAFDTLLANVEDLALDNPNAGQLLSFFIGKAIADDVLHPGYVKSRLEVAAPAAREVIRMTSVRITMPHGLARLDSVWNGGSCRRSVTRLVDQISIMLKEYLDSVDVKEAERQIRAWAVPHFHHEIVFEVVVMALEHGNIPGKESEQRVKLLTDLLATFTASSLISDDQVQLGFERVFRGLSDLVVDIPTAKGDLARLVQQGMDTGYLPSGFDQRMAEVTKN